MRLDAPGPLGHGSAGPGAAASSPADRRVDETETQTGNARDLFGDSSADQPVTLTTRHQSWTDQHGNVWRQDSGTDRNVAATRYSGVGSTGLSPDHLASLPTNPDRLLKYLRQHASGSNSTDEAMFVAVEPILQNGVAPPELRGAATDHGSLTSDTRDGAGRRAERLDFDDRTVRAGVRSICFDPHTAQVLETRTTSPGATTSEPVHRTRLTHAVPDAVRAAAARGTRARALVGIGRRLGIRLRDHEAGVKERQRLLRRRKRLEKLTPYPHP